MYIVGEGAYPKEGDYKKLKNKTNRKQDYFSLSFRQKFYTHFPKIS